MSRKETSEISKAILDMKAAESNFNEADSKFIDAAIYNYNSAKSRLEALIGNVKGGVESDKTSIGSKGNNSFSFRI